MVVIGTPVYRVALWPRPGTSENFGHLNAETATDPATTNALAGI